MGLPRIVAFWVWQSQNLESDVDQPLGRTRLMKQLRRKPFRKVQYTDRSPEGDIKSFASCPLRCIAKAGPRGGAAIQKVEAFGRGRSRGQSTAKPVKDGHKWKSPRPSVKTRVGYGKKSASQECVRGRYSR